MSIIEHPIRVEVQPDDRIRYWGQIKDFDDRVFRVITLGDGVTIHNAFPDRGFKP